MDHAQDPWVPSPRVGGGDFGGGSYPVVPAPRVAPALERIPGRVATLADRPLDAAALPSPRPSTELVPVARRSTEVAARDAGVSGVVRSCARAVVRAAQVAVDGVRSLLVALAPAPAPR
jgi:hypothetical protein